MSAVSDSASFLVPKSSSPRTCWIRNRTTSFCMSSLPVASAVTPPAPDDEGSPPYERGGGAGVRRHLLALCSSWRPAVGHAASARLHRCRREGTPPAAPLLQWDRDAHRGACAAGLQAQPGVVRNAISRLHVNSLFHCSASDQDSRALVMFTNLQQLSCSLMLQGSSACCNTAFLLLTAYGC